MKHLRVAAYEIKKGSFQELADESRKGACCAFQEQPGFVGYGVADVGHNTLASLSLWGRVRTPKPRLRSQGPGSAST